MEVNMGFTVHMEVDHHTQQAEPCDAAEALVSHRVKSLVAFNTAGKVIYATWMGDKIWIAPQCPVALRKVIEALIADDPCHGRSCDECEISTECECREQARRETEHLAAVARAEKETWAQDLPTPTEGEMTALADEAETFALQTLVACKKNVPACRLCARYETCQKVKQSEDWAASQVRANQ